MKRVWVARTRPGADETAARLRALGFEPVVEPVLETRRLTPALSANGVDALAFTSRNGVDAFAALDPRRDLPVFAVGGATAEAARAAGFSDVESAEGDVRALGALLVRRRPGRILHPTAREPAGDLAAEAAGVPVSALAVYETAERVWSAPACDAVLLHSPKAARALAAGLDPAGLDAALVCLSEAVARPLRDRGFREIVVSPFPDETALLKLLQGPRAVGQDS